MNASRQTLLPAVLGGVLLLAAAGPALPAPAGDAPISLLRGSGLDAVRADRSSHGGEFFVPMHKSQLLRVDRNFEEISIGDPEIADVVPLSRDLIYVLGKQRGSTNLTVMGPGGRVVAVVDLVVGHDIEGLKAKLFELLPNERIEVRSANGALVLSGKVSSPGQLARALSVAEQFAPGQVTNLLEVGGSQQVLLAVRFAEVQRTVSKALGFNNLFLRSGDPAAAVATGAGVAAEAFGLGQFSVSGGNLSLDVLLDVLERKGVVRTLAEPNLVVLSGDTASFLAGGEFPIPVAQEGDSGGFTITIEFKEFGVSLAFTPTVIDGDSINLALATEVSAIDPTNSVRTDLIEVPGLTVRRANTTVELGDGQSFAIAGLLQDDFVDAVRQLPWIGEVPVLGTLFRSSDFRRSQTELVIIITPRLVGPVQEELLAAPTDTFRLPDEQELFLLGRVSGRPDASAAAQALAAGRGGGIAGPYGYILE